ncbi:hypothetical protein HanIR_Chr08g0371651 [Helianthus annuus]|nr:hypothetical protein HanIR_Chr08g0371651 [Helianthus annuus]
MARGVALRTGHLKHKPSFRRWAMASSDRRVTGRDDDDFMGVGSSGGDGLGFDWGGDVIVEDDDEDGAQEV